MIMESRVKRSNCFKQLQSFFSDMFRKSFASDIFAGKAIFSHNFAMRFFNKKIWSNLGKNVVKHFSCSLPCINGSTKRLLARPSISTFFRTSKGVFQPDNQTLIATGYFKHRMPLVAISVLSLFCTSNVEASFSIDDTSKISKFSDRVIGMENNLFNHNFIIYQTVFNEQLRHRERLSEKAPLGHAIVRTLEETKGEGNNKTLRLDFLGHKSNRMVLNEAAQRLGVSLRQTEDELTRNMLASTASFINCTGGTNGDNPTEITRSDVDEVIRTLADNNAYTIADNIEGEDKFGTAPVRDAYFALGSTQLIGDLENVQGFIAKAQYPSPMHALREEWGSVSNLRFLISSIGSVSAGASNLGANVYNIFCVGLEAYAVVEQDGYSAQFIYRPPIYDGPLALNASVGYKFAQVPRITNDAWVINQRATLAA